MMTFWDGLKLASVVTLGVVVLIVGIVVYTVSDMFDALKKIVTGKR